MEVPSNPGHLFFCDWQALTTVFPTTSLKCLSSIFTVSQLWNSVIISFLFRFLGQFGRFLWNHWLCSESKAQSSQEAAGVTPVGYFWSLWKYLETPPCGGISSAKLVSIVVLSGWCRIIFVRNWEEKAQRAELQEGSVPHSYWSLEVSGGASILIFLKVKDVDLECGVIFRHYLEVWTCKTRLLGALKRTDTNRGQSKYKIFTTKSYVPSWIFNVHLLFLMSLFFH